LGRWFSVLAFLLGVAYLSQGVTWLVSMARYGAARRFFPGQYQAAVIALDVSIGLASFVIAAGLLLYKEWANFPSRPLVRSFCDDQCCGYAGS
jgi:hypothetical protein